MIRPAQPINAIFGRGGIRCIALAGAVTELEASGCRFERVAGVSAGAIIAALVAARYPAAEVRRIVWTLNYAGFRDIYGVGRVPFIGPGLALLTRRGLYRGDVLLEAMREVLARRGIRTFGDLPADHPDDGGSRFRLRVLAADLTRQRIVVLPEDAVDYGIDPAELEVARALRISASIPLVFEPQRLGRGTRSSVLVDGGLMASIPYALLKPGHRHDCPTVGILPRASAECRRVEVRGPLSLPRAAYYTALRSNDTGHLSPDQADRTIDIDCGAVRCLDFPLPDTRKAELFRRGRAATRSFLQRRPTAQHAPAAVEESHRRRSRALSG